MRVGLYIARRYLFAKKSNNVINVISAISTAGMGIGTAAIILILSIFNGFEQIISGSLSDAEPDILICSADGRNFIPSGRLMDGIDSVPEIESVCEVLEHKVFAVYAGQNAIATAKGVGPEYGINSGRLSGHLIEGEFSLHRGDLPAATVGAGLAASLGIHTRFKDMLRLHYPKSGASIPLAGPSSILGVQSVVPAGIVSIAQDEDSRLVIIPIDCMQKLLGLPSGTVSGIELRTGDSRLSRKLVRRLRDIAGEEFTVLDRYCQKPELYSMMRYEKLSIFLILIFVILIIAFNIFGSLSMLIEEKRGDMGTLRAMGASDSLIRRIFTLEGWMVSLLGLGAGLAAGLALALIQQHTGIVKMPGGLFISAYPVAVKAADIISTSVCVAAIGLSVSLAATRRHNLNSERQYK